MNAGKECVIPGRKKRRTPPYVHTRLSYCKSEKVLYRKREHLIAEIRDQAAQIQKLMAQLEMTKSRPLPRSTIDPARRSSPGIDLLSPLDPNSLDLPSPAPKPEVEEWIAKARESIEAFGGFIGAGGAGMTKSFLIDEDSESSGDNAYEFALEDEDGETVEIDKYNATDCGGDNETRQKSRSASREVQSVSGSNDLSGPLNRVSSGSGTGTQKLVTLPSEASPFGLIANLSLKQRKRRSNPAVEDEDDIGIANEDFFRPSAF
jgi:hypothetical protein